MQKVFCIKKFSLNSNIIKISSISRINKPHIHKIKKRLNSNIRCKDDKEVNLEAMMPTSIEGDIRYCQEELGGIFNEEGGVMSFDNTSLILNALNALNALNDEESIIYHDMNSHIIKLNGDGSCNFLNGLSTNSFTKLENGKTCTTVFTDRSGRMLDLAQCLITKTGILMLISKNTKQELYDKLNKHIFRGDDVEISDVSKECSILVLYGNKSTEYLKKMKFEDIDKMKRGEYRILGFSKAPIFIVKGDKYSDNGYTIIVDEKISGEFYATMIKMGVVPMGEKEYEYYRIKSGYPRNGAEITNKYNPLEANLYESISLDKGCYLGQEALSKIYTKNAINQKLIAFLIENNNNNNDIVINDKIYVNYNKRPGIVTSYSKIENGIIYGLGYIKTKDNDGNKIDELEKEDIFISENRIRAKIIKTSFLSKNILFNEITEEMNKSVEKEKKLEEMKKRMETYMKTKNK